MSVEDHADLTCVPGPAYAEVLVGPIAGVRVVPGRKVMHHPTLSEDSGGTRKILREGFRYSEKLI